MGQDSKMSAKANPNIPDEVRAVAADGTQLRYALMEMAREMDDVIALGRGDPDLDTPPHIIAAANPPSAMAAWISRRSRAWMHYAPPSPSICARLTACPSTPKM